MSAVDKWGTVAVVLIILVITALFGRGQFEHGRRTERAEWLARDNVALKQANTRIQQLEEQGRVKERQHAQDMAVAEADYQEGLKHERAAKDRVIADLRSGALRLRVAVTEANNTDNNSGNAAATLGTGTAGGDGAARAELSDAAAEFLVGLAGEADEVTRQLSACQAVVVADRKPQGEQP